MIPITVPYCGPFRGTVLCLSANYRVNPSDILASCYFKLLPSFKSFTTQFRFKRALEIVSVKVKKKNSENIFHEFIITTKHDY